MWPWCWSIRSPPAKPVDESLRRTILDLERVVPCVEEGSVLETHRAGRPSRPQIHSQDGRDVADLHRHGRDRRAGRRRPPGRHERQVAGRTGGQGHANADGRVPARATAAARSTRARRSPGKAASMGEGVVRRRARRPDHGLQRQARRSSDADRARSDRDPGDPRGRVAITTAGRRSRRTRTGPTSAATARTTTSASTPATCSPKAVHPDPDDEKGASPLRRCST